MRFASFAWLLSAVAAASEDTHEGQPAPAASPKRVAIIGAGAAGASTAHHLRKYATQAHMPLEITIFERNDYIGGRSTTVEAFNDTLLAPIELGASIFVSVNYVLQDAVKEFGLQLKEPYEGPVALKDVPFMGIYDGSKFVVTMQDSGWWSSLKMLWRYLYAPIKAEQLMKETVGKFLKIYEAPYFPFPSLTKRVYDLGLKEAAGMTGQQFLKENGIRDDFANEVIQAMTRVNYAQNLGVIHGLETMCSIATNGAVAVEGGNWRIFEAMVNASQSIPRLGRAVFAIKRHDDGTFTVASKSEPTCPTCTVYEEKFDSIVLAAPYQYANIDVKPKPQIIPDAIPYVDLHVTLFTSPHYLHSPAFGLKPDEKVPSMLLTTLQSNEQPGSNATYKAKAGFNSISLLGTRFNRKTGGDEYLYKIFSMDPVPDEFLAKILGLDEKKQLSKGDVSWVYRKLWQSYPYEFPRVTFEELRLDENFWYTGGIESFISTMETSALIGKNVAHLLVDEWKSRQKTHVHADQRQPDVHAAQEPLQAEL
ncbi:hypothetical protein, variant [Verruconis gallopava]|uniref:Prenylcysteine lyase domain-containing protein n=1 Tax=Verruconis gallopava TaxID=253628 RepID=A0A0D2AP11_9PEZI|nr:uncharacterized protein PV09_07612 [Verruconis gallopava]XP_016210723.1 hypothetical protein, variant [Verruconis gallopava]KIW00853.1 hypothetical protein PV09_07612 [Verruconis gallopava]KIW00854.1 hypothetical protein, variant [Verruconis gallopava]